MPVPINWLAIVLCMASSVVIGMFWYGPLFGKKWMALTGISMPTTQKPSMTKPIIISLIGAFFMSFVLSHNIAFGSAYLDITGINAALQGAFWQWLGFIVPVNLSFVAWEGKPWALFWIHSLYWLVLMAVMAILIVSL